MAADGGPRSHPARTDWLTLLGLAQRLLGWPPETFWRATPIELCAALGQALPPRPSVRAMTRAEMAALAQKIAAGASKGTS